MIGYVITGKGVHSHTVIEKHELVLVKARLKACVMCVNLVSIK